MRSAIQRHFIVPLLILLGLSACASQPAVPAWKPPPPPREAERTSQFLIGRYATLTNDPATAARNYTAALKDMDSPGAVLLERAIFANLQIGDVRTAAQLVGQYSGPEIEEAPLARLTYAIEQLRKGRYRTAAVLLTTEDYGPFNGIIAENIAAWAILRSSGLSDALERIDNSWQPQGGFEGLTQANRAFLAIAGGDDTSALESFEAMRASGVRFAQGIELEARILSRLGRSEDAKQILRDYLRDLGTHPVLARMLYQLEAGRTLAAPEVTTLQGAALAIFIPAATVAGQSSGDVVGVYFAMALHLNPRLDAARILWANALEQSDRRPEAISLLRGVRRSSLFYSEVQGQLAWALRREGEIEDATELARRALNVSNDRTLTIEMGELFSSLGEDLAAEEVYTELIEKDASYDIKDWRLFFARAAVRDRLGRWTEAESDLIEALDLYPRQPEILNFLGYRWIERDQNILEAMDMIQTAAAARPDASYIIDSLGWANFKIGEYETAVVHLERAVGLAPGDAEINDHLGDAYWRVGRRLEAGFQWRRALRLGVSDEVEAEIERKLVQGLDAPVTLTDAAPSGT